MDYLCDNCNTEDMPLFMEDVSIAAHVSQGAVLANAFLDRFSARFTEAEVSEEKCFDLTIAEFDAWLEEMGALPPVGDADARFLTRGRGALRQDARAEINRVSQLGKGVWPPFDIVSKVQGLLYSVRLVEHIADSLPAEVSAGVRRYLLNKCSHWKEISRYMHSERLVKALAHKPDLLMRFKLAERQVNSAFKNLRGMIETLNEDLSETYREARAVELEEIKRGALPQA